MFGPTPSTASPARGAFTVVEMLVVILVVLSVTALALGTFNPSQEERRIREASRAVHGYFVGARARAVETGRPYGVRLQRDPANPGIVRSLVYIEVPLPYSGDTASSRAIMLPPNPPSVPYWRIELSLPRTSTQNNSRRRVDFAWKGARRADDLIQAGDLIQLNYQGPLFQIFETQNAKIDRDDNRFPVVAVSSAFIRDPEAGTPYADKLGLPFHVIRQPVTAPGAPLELPEGVVIDLFHSGTGQDSFDVTSDAVNVELLFTPNGAVAAYRHTAGTMQPLQRPLFLLIGKLENARRPAQIIGQQDNPADPDNNLIDFNTRWIAVQNQTGMVTASENRGGNLDSNDSGKTISSAEYAAALARCRSWALRAQQIGGR